MPHVAPVEVPLAASVPDTLSESQYAKKAVPKTSPPVAEKGLGALLGSEK